MLKLKDKFQNLIEFTTTFLWSSVIFILSSVLIIFKIIDFLKTLFTQRKFLKLKTVQIVGIVLAFALILNFAFYTRLLPIPFTSQSKPINLIINKGESISEIAGKLKQTGVISNKKFFLLLTKILGIDRKIYAGRYEFTPGSTIYKVLGKLSSGGATAINVVIPEGLTIKQIASILKKEVNLDSAAFVSLALNKALPQKLELPGPTLEGYLFPNTYNLYWQPEAEEVITSMVQEFKNIILDSSITKLLKPNFTLKQAVILASLIEKEAQREEEKPLISAVYHNRLRKGMLLQCDPTVIYALELNRPPVLKDLEIDSPYNTYKYYGLTPGAICNPGKSSIEAALQPATVNFLYFVARGDGSHIFSATLEEHNQARRVVRNN